MTEEAVPAVGPFYGWRVFAVRGTGSSWCDDALRLTGPTYDHEWTTARMEARCQSEVRRSHAVPSEACACGLYAHATLGRCLDEREGTIRYGSITDPKISAMAWNPFTNSSLPVLLALVKASGKVIAAERGFRAERMELDTIVCVRDVWRVKHMFGATRCNEIAHRAAKQYGVDVVCTNLDKRSLERAFAHREGIYLWQKDAPWTSDVTNEPTKSSTRTSGASALMKALYGYDPTGAPSLWSPPPTMSWNPPPSITGRSSDLTIIDDPMDDGGDDEVAS